MSLKLRFSPASPFVRKVVVFAHEVGLADRLERVPTDVWSPDTDIATDNPLGKVPVMTTPEGTFIGSLLCCEYLDSLQDGTPLIPLRPPERWTVLQRHALADGVIEAAVAHTMERIRRPAAFVYPGNLERQTAKVLRTLAVISEAPPWSAIDLASLTLACALGYLDFRMPELEWRRRFPALDRWYRPMAERPSLALSRPPG